MNATNRRPENEELIRELARIVLENIDDEQFGVSALAERVGMNRSHLYRKVSLLTKKSLSQFIREIRLTEALKILKEENVTVSEVVYRVGFKNRSYFTSCFHKQFGFPPGEAKHVNLEERLLNKKTEKSTARSRFSLDNKFAFVALFFFLVIITLLTVLFLTRDKNTTVEKSIAVLPFYNDSPDKENEYFINGMMEAILDHLCKIEDLRVVGRTSVEQYRNNPKAVSEIAGELDVRYILEGSGQKYGNNIHLTLQLLDAVDEKHLWSSPYSRDVEYAEIFTLQKEIAQLVAEEIRAIIGPEEKQLIEKVPTISLTAYDFYLRGKEEYLKYWIVYGSREALERVEVLYHKAIEYDSTFALAYTGLAGVYFDKRYWETLLTEKFLDSVLILADMALSYNDQLAEAYVLKGEYYRVHNLKDQAINEFDEAIKYNPNYWEAYWRKGLLYYFDDYVNVVENLHKAASLQRGSFLPEIYRSIGKAYAHTGFKERSCYYVKEALKLDDDSAAYYAGLGEGEDLFGNFEKAIEFWKKSYYFDSTNLMVLGLLAMDHMYLGHYPESLEYYIKREQRLKALGRTITGGYASRMGYAYWVNGYEEEAENCFMKGLEFTNQLIELDRHRLYDLLTYNTLAGIHAFLGNEENAFEYLELINQRPRMSLWIIRELKYNPLYQHIRDKPEFQQIVRDVETKYQAEHERVRQYLEENDML